MFSCINFFLVISSLFSPLVLSELKPPEKCMINDSECQKQFFQNIGETYAPTGIPSIGVPIIDPFKLSDVSIDIMGFNVTLVKGEVLGIGKCVVLDYSTDVDLFYKMSELICDRITIKGRYSVTSEQSVLRYAMGNVHGDGNIILTLDDWYFKFEYPFEILRHDDGEIYLKAHFNNSFYISEVRGKADIEFDGLKIDNQDISRTVSDFVKQNWMVLNSPIMKPFHDKSVDFYYIIYGRFFDRLPAKNYIEGDLTQYIVN